jgi:hypothetical protein
MPMRRAQAFTKRASISDRANTRADRPRHHDHDTADMTPPFVAAFGMPPFRHKHLLVVACSIAGNLFWRQHAIDDRLCDRSGFSPHCG